MLALPISLGGMILAVRGMMAKWERLYLHLRRGGAPRRRDRPARGGTRVWRRLVPVILAIASVLPAHADENLKSSDRVWHAMDQCAHDAFQKFPDYTAQSNQKREAYRRACLRKKGLPAPDGPTQ